MLYEADVSSLTPILESGSENMDFEFLLNKVDSVDQFSPKKVAAWGMTSDETRSSHFHVQHCETDKTLKSQFKGIKQRNHTINNDVSTLDTNFRE